MEMEEKILFGMHHSGFFAYSVGCNVIVENLNNNHQTILTGK